MKPGDLVEITFSVEELLPGKNTTGIYLGHDHNSSWDYGEPENCSRAMVLWNDSITSFPYKQLEMINESR